MINVLNCAKADFKKILINKRVICFGAGEELIKICKEYSFFACHVDCVIDNYKSGSEIDISNCKIPVLSIERIPENLENYVFVISTIKYADEIIMQLDKNERLNNISVYIPSIFYKENIDIKIVCKKNLQIIPKKIHYCWFGNSKMPDQFKSNIETWKKHCPDYEIICWNESNYDITKCSYMYEAYKMKKWGFVPDYARLDIINDYGGIYLDTDVELLKPLDDLLGYNLYCGFESDKYVNFGLGFGAIANNTILQEMMNQYESTKFINNDGSLNLVASPVYQTEILKKHGLICNGEYQSFNDFTAFPKDFFSPIDGCGIGYPTENTYSIHQYAATWFDEKMKKDKERLKQSVNFVWNRMRNSEKKNEKMR